MIGRKYGKLIILSEQGKNKRNEKLWLCKCDCGNITIVKTYNLSKGTVKSCGCIKTGRAKENLTGKKFNKLSVLYYCNSDKWRSSLWFCKCECGNNITVSTSNLKRGIVKSCGCLFNEWKHNKPKGSASPFYNNTIIRNKRKFDLESKYWAVQVKKRDNYTCQKCNNKPSNYLVSHHLYSYIKYKSLRYDINNGITLCQNCHQVFHEKFGFFNNTKKQYEEWINE